MKERNEGRREEVKRINEERKERKKRRRIRDKKACRQYGKRKQGLKELGSRGHRGELEHKKAGVKERRKRVIKDEGEDRNDSRKNRR